MDWLNGTNGTPNNHFGRMVIDCANMTQTVFNIRGYNFVIDTLEFLNNNNNLQLMNFAPASAATIGAEKQRYVHSLLLQFFSISTRRLSLKLGKYLLGEQSLL